jgi:hypothetical protein
MEKESARAIPPSHYFLLRLMLASKATTTAHNVIVTNDGLAIYASETGQPVKEEPQVESEPQ